MKPITSFALLCAFAAVAQGAVTDPVGYTTSVIDGAFAPGSPKTSVLAPDLQNPASFVGTVSGISGDVLTITGAAFTAGEFDNISSEFLGGAAGDFYAYFVETADGYWAQIESNGVDSITVEAGAGANFTASETVTIRRHININDFFGASNEVGLLADSGGDPSAADNILIIDEVNSSSITVFASDIVGGTWVTDNFDNGGIVPIYPDQGVQVIRRETTPLPVVLTGEVDANGRQVQVTSGIQIRPYVIPVDTTLADLGLYTGNDATGIADDGGALDVGEADTVEVLVDGATFKYFVTTGLGPAQWVDDSLNPAPVLPAGAGLIINRANPRNTSPFVWVVPGPTIAP